MNVQMNEWEGVYTWAAKGQQDRAAFLAAVVADDEFRAMSEEHAWPAPAQDDVNIYLVCWDADEPEDTYVLPGMEVERQEALADGHDLTEPEWWTTLTSEFPLDQRQRARAARA